MMQGSQACTIGIIYPGGGGNEHAGDFEIAHDSRLVQWTVVGVRQWRAQGARDSGIHSGPRSQQRLYQGCITVSNGQLQRDGLGGPRAMIGIGATAQ